MTPSLLCTNCLTPLFTPTSIISTNFRGRLGRAYLIQPPPPSPTSTPSFASRSRSATTSSTPQFTSPLTRTPTNLSLGFSLTRTLTSLTTLPSSSLSTLTPTLPTLHLAPPQPRNLATGLHIVRDACCAVCGTEVGWRYEAAERRSEGYKVGKVILERERVVKVDSGSKWGVKAEGKAWFKGILKIGRSGSKDVGFKDKKLGEGELRGGIGKTGEAEFWGMMGKEDVDLEDKRAVERLFRGVTA